MFSEMLGLKLTYPLRKKGKKTMALNLYREKFQPMP